MKTEMKTSISKEDVEYPIIGHSKDTGIAVLFNSAKTGFVIHKEEDASSVMNLGEFSDSWVSVFDDNVWERPSTMVLTFKS